MKTRELHILSITLILFIVNTIFIKGDNYPYLGYHYPMDTPSNRGTSSISGYEVDNPFDTEVNKNRIITYTLFNEASVFYINDKYIVSTPGARFQIKIDNYDGLGRNTITAYSGITPNQNNLVALQEYDNLGRETSSWLPSVSPSGNKCDEPDIIKGLAVSSYNDLRPYSNPEYERSPTGRIVGEFGPGNSWATKPKRVRYETNSSTNNELICRYYYMVGATRVSNGGNYAAGKLHVTRFTDEDGKQVLEFVDNLGQKVLIRQVDGTEYINTYYVYDDSGNLCFVLPPSVADAIPRFADAGSPATAPISQYAYFYRYDERNRCIEKKLPGADPIYMVYDRADRPVLAQDGNQRERQEWSFLKYDHFGREAIRGTLTSHLSHDALRSFCRDLLVIETFTTGYQLPFIGYTNNIVLGNNIQVHSIFYYDNKAYLNLPAFNWASNLNFAQNEDETIYGNTTGLRTGSYIAQLDKLGRYELSAYYYDVHGRIVEQRSGFSDLSKKIYLSTTYDFTGNPLQQRKEHLSTDGTTRTEYYNYTYDHANRLITIKHKFGTLAETTLQTNQYNELGQLVSQILDNVKDTVNYTYNIKGWTKSIQNRAFSQQLYYEQKPMLGANRYYNGNISGCSFTQDGQLNTFLFTYDHVNRMTDATVRASDGSDAGCRETFVYDKMGNIKEITRLRDGLTLQSKALSYAGNQFVGFSKSQPTPLPAGEDIMLNSRLGSSLEQSVDTTQYLLAADPLFGTLSPLAAIDFPSPIPSDLKYDKNGNLIENGFKEITKIKYNLLNLPDTVKFKNGEMITNSYMADGRRITSKYKVSRPGVAFPEGGGTNNDALFDTTQDDVYDNYVYRNGKLSMVRLPGGYLKVDATNPKVSNRYVYHYYLYDHLGNVRLARNRTQIIQSTQYYPSGAIISQTGAGKQPYLLNEKEYISSSGLNLYDFGARSYDSDYLRWTTMDPLIEKYYSVSPYIYCLNNPVRLTDRDGRDVWEVNNDGRIVNRIQDKTQDAFYRIDPDGNRQEGENTSVAFKYGTVKEKRQTIKTKDGNEEFIIFAIKGDAIATSAFNVFIGGDGKNKVEWGHVKIGTESSGANLVGTSNDESGSPMGSYALQYGYNIRESNHSHPSGKTIPSSNDVDNAKEITKKFPKATFNIYGMPNTPVPFNKHSSYIAPKSKDSKIGKLVPGRK